MDTPRRAKIGSRRGMLARFLQHLPTSGDFDLDSDLISPGPVIQRPTPPILAGQANNKRNNTCYR
jgi:hypothetical protein